MYAFTRNLYLDKFISLFILLSFTIIFSFIFQSIVIFYRDYERGNICVIFNFKILIFRKILKEYYHGINYFD